LRIFGDLVHGQGELLILAVWSTAALAFLIRATRRLRSAE